MKEYDIQQYHLKWSQRFLFEKYNARSQVESNCQATNCYLSYQKCIFFHTNHLVLFYIPKNKSHRGKRILSEGIEKASRMKWFNTHCRLCHSYITSKTRNNIYKHFCQMYKQNKKPHLNGFYLLLKLQKINK